MLPPSSSASTLSLSTTSVHARIRTMLLRDHAADVARLRHSLGDGRRPVALVAEMPPIPYTGNPFALERGQNIAVLGINPRWPAGAWESRHGRNEHAPLRACVDRLRAGDDAALTEYLSRRHGYFDDDSSIYYGRYFTKLGNALGREFFGGDGAKKVFRRWAFKADVLPWFSENADGLDAQRLVHASRTDRAVGEYHALLSEILLDLAPRWIHCNGHPSRDVVSALWRKIGIAVREWLGRHGVSASFVRST